MTEHIGIRSSYREPISYPEFPALCSNHHRVWRLLRDAAVALASDDASAEECFQFAHALRHDRGDLKVVRRDLQRRIGQ